jgi:hypothetical protein
LEAAIEAQSLSRKMFDWAQIQEEFVQGLLQQPASKK